MRKLIKTGLLFLLLLSVFSLSAREYTIIPYDNLWNLSEGFYQSGLEWPRIWKANPYIVNPDLIYPGDVLVVPGIGEIRLNKDGTYQVRGITFDDRVASLFTNDDVVDTAVALSVNVDMYIDKKIKEFLISESAVITVPYICSDTSKRGLVEPGIAAVDDLNRKSYMQYSTVKVASDDGTPLSKGRYTLVEPVKYLELNGSIVNLMKPVGECEVRGVDSVFIRRCWDIVSDSARVVPCKEFSVQGGVIVKEKAAPIEVKLLTRVSKDVIYHQYEMVILEAGSKQGVTVGDLLDAFIEKERDTEAKKVNLEVLVVKVQDETATAVVTQAVDIVKDGPLLFKRSGRLAIETHEE